MKMTEKRARGRPRLLDRRKALESALRLFWQHGYEGTSIADLTAAIGVAPPSLYAAFGSKERLYREALDLYAETYGGFAAKALREAPTARQAIEQILAKSIALYAGGPHPRGCMLVTGALTCASENEEVTHELAQRRGTAIALIQARFDDAVAAGELPAGTDTRALAAYYAAVVQGLSIQARDGATPEALHAIASLALTVWPKLPAETGAA